MVFDQTEAAWLHRFPTAQGTGLLLVEGPGPDRVERIVLHDVTHKEFLSSATRNGAVAMKWVPHAIRGANQLLMTNCGMACVSRCAEPGCVCFNGKCVGKQ